jgi:hypothetical protein
MLQDLFSPFYDCAGASTKTAGARSFSTPPTARRVSRPERVFRRNAFLSIQLPLPDPRQSIPMHRAESDASVYSQVSQKSRSVSRGNQAQIDDPKISDEWS